MVKNKHHKYNETVELLISFRAINRHIKILENRLLEIEEYKNNNIQAVHTDGVRISVSRNLNKMCDKIISVDEMYKKVVADIKKEKELIEIIKKGISVLSETERDIVTMTYFDSLSVNQIGDYLGYERTQVWRKKEAAVNKIATVVFGPKCNVYLN